MKTVIFLFLLGSMSIAQISSASDSIVSNDTISGSTDTTITSQLLVNDTKIETTVYDSQYQYLDLKKSFDSLLTINSSFQNSISALEDKTLKIQRRHSKLLKISGLTQILLGATALTFTIIEANWVDKIPYETSTTYTSTKPSTKGKKYTVTEENVLEVPHEWTFISTCLATLSGSLMISGSIFLTF